MPTTITTLKTKSKSTSLQKVIMKMMTHFGVCLILFSGGFGSTPPAVPDRFLQNLNKFSSGFFVFHSTEME
ncbi:hypothetical protein QVD17_40814 [Tagetes erecta]|uniref:Uncharacterized protein n=1 Tax=Tagetes erecta TaxID=13708 RepID=A0AAD8JRV4_TARER|nr:hypothetical protein QVD17_40814 [Tagetes erecta]